MAKICIVEGCESPARARGLCGKHYHRWQRRFTNPIMWQELDIPEPIPTYGRKYEKGGQCAVTGCSNFAAYGHAYCAKHATRLKRHGSLEPISRDKSGVASEFRDEYRTWNHLKGRCLTKTDRAYKDYGGRGIKVCDRWLEKPYGFRNFLEDMGPKPSPKSQYSIDRIDNDGDYCPENCRWATAKEQANNRRPRHR